MRTQNIRILENLIAKGIAIYRCQQLLGLVRESDESFWTGSARIWGMKQIADNYKIPPDILQPSFWWGTHPLSGKLREVKEGDIPEFDVFRALYNDFHMYGSLFALFEQREEQYEQCQDKMYQDKFNEMRRWSGNINKPSKEYQEWYITLCIEHILNKI